MEDIFEEKCKRHIETCANSLPKHLVELLRQRYWGLQNSVGKNRKIVQQLLEN
jgi:hypothetical protein